MSETFNRKEDEIAQAVEAANAVFDDPDAPLSFEPTTFEAARAAVEQLGVRLATLSGTARLLVEGARQGGEMLSNDRLQGLSEIAQNAEDVGATSLTFKLSDSELIASHNGQPVTLKNVWALSLPWMTTKTSEDQSLGRFGIGLTALRVISPTFDVFCWPYAIRLDGSALSSLDLVDGAGELIGDGSFTRLRVSLYPDVLDSDVLVGWLEEWSESALLFCEDLTEISFETPQGVLKTLRLRWGNPRTTRLEVGGQTVSATRMVATAPDGRRWVRWTTDVATPRDLARRYKKKGTTMPLGVAVPLFKEPIGRIHAGLPLTDIESPVAVNAHFDPTTGRQGLLDNDWNALLIELVAELWVEAMLDLFRTRPRIAWRLVPRSSGSQSDPSNPVQAALLDKARTDLAARLAFSTDSGDLPLSATAYEAKLLDGVLNGDQIAALAKSVAALPLDVRDKAGCWRDVLDDWRSAGVNLPDPVTVADALPLLEDDIEVAQTVALAAAALKDDLEDELPTRAWLSDDKGQRHAPPLSPNIWTFTTSNDQWALDLELARRIHPDTLAQGEASTAVVAWLRRYGSLIDRVDPGAYLERLAAVGEAGQRMSTPLSESQLLSIRDAIEQLPPHQQQRLGPGIGRAILVEAFEYTGRDRRVAVNASPSDVYLPRSIDREPDSFAVAAGATKGILWAASRYSTVLRSPHGRAGLGAQRFLRILGAETGPRLVPHPDLRRRYESDNRLGLSKYGGGSPRARSEFLTSLEAQYTLDDYESPDLDAVLEDIASHRQARQRRTRATALVSSLGRAWDRIGDKAEVTAADDYYGWNIRDKAPAFWIWRARTVEWLDNTRARPSAPNELWLRTPANVVVHGVDSDDYLHKDIPSDRPEILTLLGVTGEPTMAVMVDRLVELRDLEAEGGETSSADTALLYKGIAGQVGRRRQSPGHLNATRLKSRFLSGRGLIRTDGGWRRPSDLLAGPPVFGHLRSFVPQVEGTEPLWRTLDVPEPSWRHCVEVLQQVAAMNQDEDVTLESIELDTLRLLARLIQDHPLPTRSGTRLAKLPVRTSQGRTSSRPVFVIPDPVVAEAVAPALPIWRPGGELEQFSSLIEPFQITRLDPGHIRIAGTEDAAPDEETTELFRAAVAHLREDLVRNDPPAAASLVVDWSVLESFNVLTVGGLTAHVKPPNGAGREVSGTIHAYADPDQASLYITDADQLDNYDSGARALASLFSGDSRRIAQAWLAACAAADAGREARRLELADVKAEEEMRRQDKALGDLTSLQAETSAKPVRSTRKRRSTTEADESPEQKGSAPRQLVDPGELVVINLDGQIVGGELRPKRRRSKPRSKGLASVRSDSKPLRSHASPKEYTEIDKETVGLDLVRIVLRSDDAALADLRSQRGVGADAVDELRRFYELKVYKGDEPNEVRLESSEIERAKQTEGFFLVVLSNVEVGHGITKVRIITDPLNQLERVETRAVSFSGVRTAASLVYELAAPAERDTSDQEEEENG